METTLLEDYEREIRIRIGGRDFLVPENNTLLRILQHLAFEISYSRFCWNGDCHNCIFSYRSGAQAKKALACRVQVVEGMEITELPEGIGVSSGGPSLPSPGRLSRPAVVKDTPTGQD